MPVRTGAASLSEHVAFDQPASADDGAGGVRDGFVEAFCCRAQFIHIGRGSESVLAARLEGQHTLVMRIRASSQSRSVTSDWRVRDKRRGTVFAVKDVTELANRAWIDVLVQSGVAP